MSHIGLSHLEMQVLRLNGQLRHPKMITSSKWRRVLRGKSQGLRRRLNPILVAFHLVRPAPAPQAHRSVRPLKVDLGHSLLETHSQPLTRLLRSQKRRRRRSLRGSVSDKPLPLHPWASVSVRTPQSLPRSHLCPDSLLGSNRLLLCKLRRPTRLAALRRRQRLTHFRPPHPMQGPPRAAHLLSINPLHLGSHLLPLPVIRLHLGPANRRHPRPMATRICLRRPEHRAAAASALVVVPTPKLRRLSNKQLPLCLRQEAACLQLDRRPRHLLAAPGDK